MAVETADISLEGGCDLYWEDLPSGTVPQLAFYGTAETDDYLLTVDELVVVLGEEEVTGTLVFEYIHVEGYTVTSMEGVEINGDYERVVIDGPIELIVGDTTASGRALELAMRYGEPLPHDGSLELTTELVDLTMVLTTHYQENSPSSGWVLVHEHSERVKLSGDLVEVDLWSCRNVNSGEEHEAAEDATCPVEE
jgi:hypothetical protein